jgi:hypothetical protein
MIAAMRCQARTDNRPPHDCLPLENEEEEEEEIERRTEGEEREKEEERKSVLLPFMR